MKILLLLLSIFFIFSCAPKCQIPTVETADIVIIQKEGNSYNISLDGFKIQEWWCKNVIIKIDSTVTKSRATFLKRNNKPLGHEPITLFFNNIEAARKELAGGSEIDIDGNNNIAVQNKNKNNCFINSL